MNPALARLLPLLVMKLLDLFKPGHRKGQPVLEIAADKLTEHTTKLGLAELTAFAALVLPELGVGSHWAQPCGAALLALLSVWNVYRRDPVSRPS